jgi:hypothetical protein
MNFLMTAPITNSTAQTLMAEKQALKRGYWRDVRPINLLKLLSKMENCDFYAPPADVVRFCTENDSKALALCAARSHIVAVR